MSERAYTAEQAAGWEVVVNYLRDNPRSIARALLAMANDPAWQKLRASDRPASLRDLRELTGRLDFKAWRRDWECVRALAYEQAGMDQLPNEFAKQIALEHRQELAVQRNRASRAADRIEKLLMVRDDLGTDDIVLDDESVGTFGPAGQKERR